jgi:hypothetical protein
MESTRTESPAPSTWDPALDAVAAAPDTHQVLYEDDVIRVLSVSLPPGMREPVHHHRWPSVFVIDRLVPLRDFDGDGNEIAFPIPEGLEFPVTVKLPPQPPHSVLNEGTGFFHGTRIEFKQGFPVSRV